VGESDFALVDFNKTGFRALDVGVLLGSGAEAYRVQTATSIYRGGYPNGAFGPFTMPADRLLDLHEFTLDGGTYDIRLENVAGTVDWGLSLYSGATAYHAKAEALPGGMAWLAGPGSEEQFSVEVPADGYHCLAVWKVGASDLPLEGSYILHVTKQSLDAPVHPGSALDFLAAPRPNPCGASAVLGFGLVADQEARLAVFDLRGARVRTLVDGRVGAGPHGATWDGLDDAGRPVSPGMYLVRLEAGRVQRTVRLVKLE
jgi:hypothetical protein